MYGRGEYVNTQSWKERFVQLMKEHKPQDKWILTVSDDLKLCPPGWYQYGQKQLFARFECSCCQRKWKSTRSVIHFHVRLEKNLRPSQGQVKMRKFRQKCRLCINAKYENPVFSDQAFEAILYNLALKILEKMYGEPKKRPRCCDVEEFVEGPHEIGNCEACEHGMCFKAQTSQPTEIPSSRDIFMKQAFVKPSSLISSIGWEECFMIPASPTRSMGWESNYRRPASLTQSTEEQWQTVLVFFGLLVVVLLFFAAAFQK